MLATHPWRDAIGVELVANAQMPDQRSLRCSAGGMVDALAAHDIRNTAIIFVSVPRSARRATAPLRMVAVLA